MCRSGSSRPSSAGGFAVNRLGNHDRSKPFAPDFDFNGGAWFRELRRHIAQADADTERWALRAADDFADPVRIRAGAPDRIMWPWRRRFVGDLERDAFFATAFFLLPGQHGTPDKIPFVERHKKSQSGLDGRGIFVEFVPVKRVAHL